MKNFSILIGAALCAVLCSFSSAQNMSRTEPEPAAEVSAVQPVEVPTEPVSEPPTEPPAEPDKGSAIANALRRQKIAAKADSGLDIPGNEPVCIKWTTTAVTGGEGSSVSESGEILDCCGNTIAMLSGNYPALCSAYEYGDNGELLRQYSIAEGTVMGYREYSYRQDGSLYETYLFNRDEYGAYQPSRYQEFDSSENLTSEGYCYSGGRTSSRIVANEYSSGQLSVVRSYRGGVEVSCEKRFYNGSGELIFQTISYSGEVAVTEETTEYSYLPGGELSKMCCRSYLRDGSLWESCSQEFTYDADGRTIGEITRKNGGETVIAKSYSYEEI